MNYLSISNREEDRRQREIAFNTSLQFLKFSNVFVTVCIYEKQKRLALLNNIHQVIIGNKLTRAQKSPYNFFIMIPRSTKF